MLFYFPVHGKPILRQEVKNFLKPRWDLNNSQYNNLWDAETLAWSDVSSKDSNQTFQLKVAALHPKKCRKALKKISLLENYKDWIGFIKRSTYHEKSLLWTLRADHPLLPSAMLIHVLLERPTKPGKYSFSFPTGMFTGLTGEFEIVDIGKKRCLLFAKSHWTGKSTKFPDLVIEIFSETLSKLGGDILMRKTM